jgi:hypothetical protein
MVVALGLLYRTIGSAFTLFSEGPHRWKRFDNQARLALGREDKAAWSMPCEQETTLMCRWSPKKQVGYR